MKNIKRLLSLILALVLCTSLAACGSGDNRAAEEDKAFEEADALLAAGDYEGAIAAFSAIGRYQEITDKIMEAEHLRYEAERLQSLANAEGLFGKWINAHVEAEGITMELTLNADGTVVMNWGDSVHEGTFGCKDNTLSLLMMGIDLQIEQKDGITHLVADEFNMDFVSEADYPAFAPVEIEITADNWQEYFELKEVTDITVNAFGEVDSIQPSVGVFLKEKYYSRLPANYWDADLAFELTYDDQAYKLLGCTPEEFDYNFVGQYEMEPAAAPSWYPMETGHTMISNVSDNRNAEWLAEQSPYQGTFSARFFVGFGMFSDNSAQYITGWTNVQVSRVIGTLRLYP